MPLPSRVSKFPRSLAREHIRSRLQSWIVEGELQPEEVLDAKKIAAAFGVSRMPVREALRSLEDQGFIETALNRWTRVAPLRPEKAQDHYEVISTLEAQAMRSAYPHLDANDFASLRKAIKDLEAAVQSKEVLKAMRADVAFHSVWINRASNSELCRIIDESRTKLLRIELAFFHSAEDIKTSCGEHGQILASLEGADLELAVGRLGEHWSSSVKRCLGRMLFAGRKE